MPRRSSVDAAQVGPRIIQLAYTDHMSIPDIQKKLARESDVHLSEGAIRTYLDKVPKEVVEKAERVGLIQKVEPILEYRADLQRMFKELGDLQARLREEYAGAGLESDASFVAGLAEEFGVDIDTVQSIVKRTERERQGHKTLRLFFTGMAELRKTLELAAKLDQSLYGMGQKKAAGSSPAPAGPIHIKNAVITGMDLTSLVDEATHRFKGGVTGPA